MLHKFGKVGLWMGVQYACVCVTVCVFEGGTVGCRFVEATYVPSVQEMKQRERESENTVHPQLSRKTRACPCPKEESEREQIHVFICVCVYDCILIQILFHC